MEQQFTETLQGSFHEKSNISWSLKECIVLRKHTVTFRTQVQTSSPKSAKTDEYIYKNMTIHNYTSLDLSSHSEVTE